MAINVLMVIVGLVICFGGVYYRKFFTGAIGLIWGLLIGFAIMLAVSAGSMYSSRSGGDSSIAIVVIAAVVLAGLSAAFDRAFTAISSFLMSLALSALLILAFSRGSLEISAIIIIALIVAAIVGGLSAKYYLYAVMINSAFTGALITSIGGTGLARGFSVESLPNLLFGGYGYGYSYHSSNDSLMYIIFGTLVLGIIGCIVQHRRIRQEQKQVNAG